MELVVYNKKVLDIIDPAAEIVKFATGFNFTEGGAVRGDTVYFTDFRENRIYAYKNGEVSLVTDDSKRTIGLTVTPDGRLLGCASAIHAIMDIDTGETVVDSFFGFPLNGTNDVIADSAGRIYFTDPNTKKDASRPFSFSPVLCYDGGAVMPVIMNMPFPNGLALSPDEQTLYVAESNTRRLYAVNLSNLAPRLLTQLSKGMGDGVPDGLRVAPDGTIFLTGGGGILIISPEGEILGKITTPEIAANLCFYDEGLFVTASTSVYYVPLK
jgi:gluconolactonase